MNGQLHNLVKIVELSRLAVRNELHTEYVFPDFYRSIQFRKKCINSWKTVAQTPNEWYRYLHANNCLNVYIDLIALDKDREKFAFANGPQGQVMICAYNRYYEVWQSRMEYVDKKWEITYYCIRKVKSKFLIKDSSIERGLNDLLNSYIELSVFAKEIEYDFWTDFFREGADNVQELISSKDNDVDSIINKLKWPFGGMCSWNDSPPGLAKDLGRLDDYERLSKKLYDKLLFAIETSTNNS